MHDLQLDYLVVSETKLDDSFPSGQFAIESYEIRERRDRDGRRGRSDRICKKGITCKRVKQFETVIWESICLEIIISRKKWFCMGIYKPSNFDNLDTFFKEVSDSLSKASLTYENFIIMGDFTIDISTAGVDADRLDEFWNLLDLTNLMKTETCCTKNYKWTIDCFWQKELFLFKKSKPPKPELA